MSTSQSSSLSFAARLDHLFKTMTKPDGKEYTYEEVQDGTNKAVTAAYVWRLRAGKATNPGYWVVKALSEFFHVEPNYFFTDDSEQVETMVDAGQVMAEQFAVDETVQEIALRASELDEESKDAVLNMINHIVKLKQIRRDDIDETEGFGNPPSG